MAEMIQLGVVKVVKQRPSVVSPLGLVPKEQEDGTIKHRLVFDTSTLGGTLISLSTYLMYV